MNREEILRNLASNNKLIKIAHNIAGAKGLGNDLFQHLCLVLCEFPEQKLFQAVEGKYIEYTCIVIMQNSYKSLSSPFAKQYRQHENDLSLNEPVSDGDRGMNGDIEWLDFIYKDPRISNAIFHEIDLDQRISEEEIINDIQDYLEQDVNQDNFYRVELLRRWAGIKVSKNENGEKIVEIVERESYRKIAQQTKIPMRSIAGAIQSALNEIRQECL